MKLTPTIALCIFCIIAGFFIGLQCCPKCPEVKTETTTELIKGKTDTTEVKHEKEFSGHTPTPVKVIKHKDKKPDISSDNISRDSIPVSDSSGQNPEHIDEQNISLYDTTYQDNGCSVRIMETVAGRILNQFVKITSTQLEISRVDTVKEKTTSVVKEKKRSVNALYIGGQFVQFDNDIRFYPSLIWGGNKFLFNVGYDPFEKNYTAGAAVKISLRRK